MYFFKAGTSAQHQPFQKSYVLEKTDFLENQFLHYQLFLKRCLFGATAFSKDATFYSSHLFQKSYYFIATVSFHSYTSSLFFNNYVNSVPVNCSLSVGVFFPCIYYCSKSHHRWLNKCFHKSYFSRRCFS